MVGYISSCLKTRSKAKRASPTSAPDAPSIVRLCLQGLWHCSSGLVPSSGTMSASPGTSLVDRAPGYLNLHVIVVRCARVRRRTLLLGPAWLSLHQGQVWGALRHMH